MRRADEGRAACEEQCSRLEAELQGSREEVGAHGFEALNTEAELLAHPWPCLHHVAALVWHEPCCLPGHTRWAQSKCPYVHVHSHFHSHCDVTSPSLIAHPPPHHASRHTPRLRPTQVARLASSLSAAATHAAALPDLARRAQQGSAVAEQLRAQVRGGGTAQGGDESLGVLHGYVLPSGGASLAARVCSAFAWITHTHKDLQLTWG